MNVSEQAVQRPEDVARAKDTISRLRYVSLPDQTGATGHFAALATTAADVIEALLLHTGQPQIGCAKEGDGRISFPRWWVQQTYASLKAIDTANVPGHPGDVIFLLRDMLGDALSAPPPPVAESGWQEIETATLDAALQAFHTVVRRYDYNEREGMLCALEAVLRPLPAPPYTAEKQKGGKL